VASLPLSPTYPTATAHIRLGKPAAERMDTIGKFIIKR